LSFASALRYTPLAHACRKLRDEHNCLLRTTQDGLGLAETLHLVGTSLFP
jgi:hypothetical protein